MVSLLSTIHLCFVAAYGLNECNDEKIKECLNVRKSNVYVCVELT